MRVFERGLEVALRVWEGFLAKECMVCLHSEDRTLVCLDGRFLDAALVDFKSKG